MKMCSARFLLALLVLWVTTHERGFAQVVINEIMASNASVNVDEDGDFEDWIELYNAGPNALDIGGWGISDKLNEPHRWVFPPTILWPGDFLLVFASGKDRVTGSFLHTNFAISASGESIVLSDAEGIQMDLYPATAISTDNSFGRITDGAEETVHFQGATPGYSNDGQPLLQPWQQVVFTMEQGFHASDIMLGMGSNGAGEVRFTLDGSLPGPDSHLFTEDILITDRTPEPNGISTIPTNPTDSPVEFVWKAPKEQVFKGTVVRAAVFAGGQQVSDVATRTYFISPDSTERFHGVPVVSLVMDSADLFGFEKGMYVPGVAHALDPTWPWYWGTGNYFNRGEEWERLGSFTFFDPSGAVGLHQDVGVRIHGSGSRALPQKSFRIYARDNLGESTLQYPFFSEAEHASFKRVLLRNGGQGFMQDIISDGVASVSVRHLDLERQSYRPVVVFINGEFWGIQAMRDRVDRFFLEYAADADPDLVDLVDVYGEAMEGSADDHYALSDFVRDHDLSDDQHYQHVAASLDIGNFIDYNIAKQYHAVLDWPGNNVDRWKQRVSGSKWRYVFFDNDLAMTASPDFDAIEHSTTEHGESWPNPEWSTRLLRKLLEHEDFRARYLERWEYHLKHTFAPHRMIGIVDSISSIVAPMVSEHIARWGYPTSVGEWEYTVESMRYFGEIRACEMRKILIRHFDLDSTFASDVCNAGVPGLLSEGEIRVFPNPAVNDISIHVHTDRYSDRVEVRIVSMSGATAHHVSVPSSPYVTRIHLPISHLAPGVYAVQVVTDHKSHSGRVVIMGR